MADSITESPLMTPPETSGYLNEIPEATLAQWRYRGIGPRYLKVGKHVRYRRSDVDAWLERQAAGDAA